MFGSIRWRLVTSYVLLTLVIVGSVGMLALWAVWRHAQQQEVRSLTANAEAVAHQVLPLLEPGSSSAELTQLVEAASFFGNARVRVLDRQGRVLADSGYPSGQEEMVLFLLPEDNEGIFSGAAPESWILGLPRASEEFPLDAPVKIMEMLEDLPPGTSSTVVRRSSGPWGYRFSFEGTVRSRKPTGVDEVFREEAGPRSQRTIQVPVGDGSSPIGYVELSAGTDFGVQAVETTRQAFILAGGAALVLAGILGLFMGKRISAPLIRLTEIATRMSAGDLSVRAPQSGQDETGRLSAQFNQMAGQLQASFEQLAAERDALRRFIADASHELRTPITALKSFNELLQGAAADDPAVRAEFLAESQAQIERLEWITHNLLNLSRLDAGLAALNIQEHDLGEVLEASASPFRALAAEKGITLQILKPIPPLEVRCDRERLEMALSNLLDNALKFTPAGGVVEAGGEAAGATTRIWIEDSGPGIHPDDLPHVFDRFFRGRNPAGAGSGLGLSIAQSIVHAHGGRITVDSAPDRGARFTIELP